MKYIVSAFLIWLATSAFAETVTIFAASSLQDALDEIAHDWETETGHKVVISYAGSGTLARQIEEGAPADIFFSANSAWMNYLEEREEILPDTRIDIVGNELVMIAHERSPFKFILDFKIPHEISESRIAIANVETVPSGIYGKQALSYIELWESLAPNLVQTESARMTLNLVAQGEVDFGIVFSSDAFVEPKVCVLKTFVYTMHDPIIYPVAITKQAKNGALAKSFIDHLNSDPTHEIFASKGFHKPGVKVSRTSNNDETCEHFDPSRDESISQ